MKSPDDHHTAYILQTFCLGSGLRALNSWKTMKLASVKRAACASIQSGQIPTSPESGSPTSNAVWYKQCQRSIRTMVPVRPESLPICPLDSLAFWVIASWHREPWPSLCSESPASAARPSRPASPQRGGQELLLSRYGNSTALFKMSSPSISLIKGNAISPLIMAVAVHSRQIYMDP